MRVSDTVELFIIGRFPFLVFNDVTKRKRRCQQRILSQNGSTPKSIFMLVLVPLRGIQYSIFKIPNSKSQIPNYKSQTNLKFQKTNSKQTATTVYRLDIGYCDLDIVWCL